MINNELFANLKYTELSRLQIQVEERYVNRISSNILDEPLFSLSISTVYWCGINPMTEVKINISMLYFHLA